MCTGPGAKNFAVTLIQPPKYLKKMFIRLAAAKNHFRKTRTDFSVHIQLGILQFFKGLAFEKALGLLHRDHSIFNVL